jgi:hypothetical protein
MPTQFDTNRVKNIFWKNGPEKVIGEFVKIAREAKIDGVASISTTIKIPDKTWLV